MNVVALTVLGRILGRIRKVHDRWSLCVAHNEPKCERLNVTGQCILCISPDATDVGDRKIDYPCHGRHSLNIFSTRRLDLDILCFLLTGCIW
jgi:hypothetical protein